MFSDFLRALRPTPTQSRSSRNRIRPYRRLRGMEGLEPRQMMSAVPAFSSMPGAEVTIYLDFDGHNEAEWGEIETVGSTNIWHDVVTPVFSIDNNSNFSATELQMIEQIWKCVAEDFAPFNINVTTVMPAEFAKGAGLRVAIGGSWEDWYQKDPIGGISVQGGYIADGYAKTVYVFSEEFSTARTIADCASQEVGHSFGLSHQSIWNNWDGSLIEEYNPGTPHSAPLMGVPYWSERSLWWNDHLGQNGWGGQDDMAVMTAGQNLFSFRTDDHGNTAQSATVLSNYRSPVSGVISSNLQNQLVGEEIDCFLVTLPNNAMLKQWTVSIEVDSYSANLDAKLEIYRTGTKLDGKLPTLIGIADPNDDLGAMLNFSGGGQYLIKVRSHGGYGDLGQFTLQISQSNIVVANANPIFRPPLIDVICNPLSPIALPGMALGKQPAVTLPALPTVAKETFTVTSGRLGNADLSGVGDSLKPTASKQLTNLDSRALDAAFGELADDNLCVNVRS